MQTTTDEDGNEIAFDGQAYWLNIPSRKKEPQRRIGELVRVGENIYLSSDRNFKTHFFRKTCSWAFSNKLVEIFMKSFPDGYLGIRSDVGTFSIKASEALAMADYLHFKKKGFELQLMVHHSHFNKKNISEEFNKFIREAEPWNNKSVAKESEQTLNN